MFVVEGSLDLLMDFRKAFDQALLLHKVSSTSPSSASVVRASIDTTAMEIEPCFVSEDPSAGVDVNVSEFYPPTLFDAHPDLLPDVLAIMEKVPAGQIPGVNYWPKTGTIYIDKNANKDDVVSKFQKEYQNIITGKKLKVEDIDVPNDIPEASISKFVEDFNNRYSCCVFSFVKDRRVIKIISTSSRQFDQAKKHLSEQLQSMASCFVPIDESRVLTLKKSDIVLEEVDVLVNAANGMLNHAGGVALAIDRASGGAVQRHSNKIMRGLKKRREFEVGSVVTTDAGGRLKCKHVIHAVGPTKSHRNPGEILRRLTWSILKEAQKLKARSIAIPAISTGIFNVDNNLVANCILDIILNGYKYPPKSPLISDVRVVIINDSTYQCFFNYLRQLKLVAPPPRKQPSVEAAAPSPRKLPSVEAASPPTKDETAGSASIPKDDNKEVLSKG